jgi:two-component system chemotaxis response regulator CheB
MIRLVVVGASSGGIEAIRMLLSKLPVSLNIPVIIVLHIGNNKISTLLTLLNNKTSFMVKEAEEQEIISPKTVYFAPPNYHIQVEENRTITLSTDAKVNFSRPSIDVLFETAAWVYKDEIIGILLTGSNNDGSIGLLEIKKHGGKTIVENPKTAFSKTMPYSATTLFEPDYIINIEDIADKITELCKE